MSQIDYVQACTNGVLHDARTPAISPLNRGFLYGDAIYEVWRTYHGVIFAWEEHWQRLERSAAALHLSLPLTLAKARQEIARSSEAFRGQTGYTGELYIRLQITRGGGSIGLDPALADQADYTFLVQPNRLYPETKYRAGLALSLAQGLRRNPVESLNPAWKTGNYLNNILCLREARARSADEVVILNLAGEVTEAAVSNIAFVRDGRVLTPPRTAGILGGITRELLLREVAALAGVRMSEATLRPADFPGLQECFLISTTKDITPVASIDAARFTVGHDTTTARLKAAFAQFAQRYAEAHPQLRLFSI